MRKIITGKIYGLWVIFNVFVDFCKGYSVVNDTQILWHCNPKEPLLNMMFWYSHRGGSNTNHKDSLWNQMTIFRKWQSKTQLQLLKFYVSHTCMSQMEVPAFFKRSRSWDIGSSLSQTEIQKQTMFAVSMHEASSVNVSGVTVTVVIGSQQYPHPKQHMKWRTVSSSAVTLAVRI